MRVLLRLYPRSWRRRYGREMEVLLEDLGGETGVFLDLAVGAVIAYAAVVRGNRVLTTAAAFLHGVCVAVLLQAIAFVILVLAGNHGAGILLPVGFGPVHIATFWRSTALFGLEARLSLPAAGVGLTASAMLAALVVALAALLLVPRLVKAPAS